MINISDKSLDLPFLVKPSIDEYLTTKEAANLLKVTPTRIQQLILSNKFPAMKKGNIWLVAYSDLQAYCYSKNDKAIIDSP